MLQHSSYISLWHFVLHLAIIVATQTHTHTHVRGCLINFSARFFFLPLNDTSIINGNQRGNLYYSKAREQNLLSNLYNMLNCALMRARVCTCT